MTPTHAAHSTTVGDANPGEPLEDLIVDLGHITHDSGLKRYLWLPGVDLTRCSYKAFAGEREGDRAAFEAHLRGSSIPEDEVASLLGQWDSAQRPVAICHWFPVGG